DEVGNDVRRDGVDGGNGDDFDNREGGNGRNDPGDGNNNRDGSSSGGSLESGGGFRGNGGIERNGGNSGDGNEEGKRPIGRRESDAEEEPWGRPLRSIEDVGHFMEKITPEYNGQIMAQLYL